MFQRFPIRGAFVLLAIMLLWNASLYAKAISSESKVNIKADRAIYFYKQHKVKFLGHVYVVKGEMKIRCREVTFFLKRNMKIQKKGSSSSASDISQGSNLERIIAKGDVHIFLQNREGFADEADYDLSKDTITLIGNVLLRQEKNEIKGERLVIDLATNTSEIFPSKGKQVEIIFYSSSGEPQNGTSSKGK